MITSFFIGLGSLILSGFAAILPDSVGLPAEFETALQTFFGNAYAFNSVFPVDTLVQVAGLLISFEVGIMLYRLTRWVFASIPFSSIKH